MDFLCVQFHSTIKQSFIILNLINIKRTICKYLYYINSNSCFKARCKICEKFSCFSSAL